MTPAWTMFFVLNFGAIACFHVAVPLLPPGNPNKMLGRSGMPIFGTSHRRALELTLGWRALRSKMAQAWRLLCAQVRGSGRFCLLIDRSFQVFSGVIPRGRQRFLKCPFLASYFSTPAMAFFGPRGRFSFIFRVFLH